MPPKCKPCAKPMPMPVAPAWADPRLSMAVSAMRFKTVALPFGTAVQILRADPMRIAWGCTQGTNPSATFGVAPVPDAQNSGFPVTSQVGWIWFDLFTFGPLVNADWFGYSGSGITIAVYEVYLLAGG